MGYSKKSSKLAKTWLDETLKLKPGAELFIPCDSKAKQGSLKTRLYGARKEYAQIDPLTAESISFTPVFRDGEPYIKCHKSKIEANKGFVKQADGTIKVVTIDLDSTRNKKFYILKREGKGIPEIEAILGKLTEEELEIFKIEEN